jgi:excisionase family DNA binding protein
MDKATSSHTLDLSRYFESPEAACVALGISRPTLQVKVREGTVRSIKIGRTRLIERPAQDAAD